MKKEIRILGIDDSPFDKFNDSEVLVIGTVFRGGDFLDGLLTFKVQKDGDDFTLRLIDAVNNSKFKPQLQAILLGGLAVAGFNVVNATSVFERTGIPIIIIMRSEPEKGKMEEALVKLGFEAKAKLVSKLPSPRQYKEIFYQVIGGSDEFAISVLNLTCTRSNIPEPLRVAHIIASGVALGESKGSA